MGGLEGFIAMEIWLIGFGVDGGEENVLEMRIGMFESESVWVGEVGEDEVLELEGEREEG